MGFEQRGRLWRWCVVVLMEMVAMNVNASDSHSKQEQQLVSRIAFGSCSNQTAPQPIWDAVVDFHPQVFIWLGDNIYGDIKRPFKLFGRERTIGPWKNAPRFVPSSEQEMEAKYRKAKSNPGYAQLKQNAEVIGTWDDHDYGLNDAGKEFHGKIINQKLLLDFLDEPQDSPRRKQAGVYASYKYGPKGRDVKIILLDTRYHRDPVGSDGTILGNSQWLWLEKELKGPSTAITVIGSSIQVISNLSATIHPLFSMESWAHFPKERERLFKLIADSKRGGVFFISGDVHFGEITRYDCAVDYPLYDVTSSGVTQSVEGVVPPFLRPLVRFVTHQEVISNLSATIHPLFSMESWAHFPKERERLFKLIADSKRGGVFFISGDVHFGEITRYDCAVDYPLYDVTSSGVTQSVEGVVPPFLRPLVRFVAWLTPSTMRVKGPNCRYKSCVYGQPNFGTIEIDWDSHPVTLKLNVRDKNGVAVTGVDISLVKLQVSNSETPDRVKAGHVRRHCTLEVSLPWIIRYRLAILVFFTLAVLLLAFVGLVYTAITVCRQRVCKRKPD